MSIKTNTRSMADILKEHVTIESGVATVTGDILDLVPMPCEISKDDYKTVQNHDTSIARALELAIGEKAVDVLKADKTLERVSAKVKVGARHYEAVIERKTERNKAAPGQPKLMVDVYGAARGGYSTASSSEHKAVRTHIQELAMAAFGK